MKAIAYSKYGDPNVLKVAEINIPNPKPNEILVKLNATAVNSGDCKLRTAKPFAVRFFFGFFRPKKPVLGCVFSGEIKKTGDLVENFNVGEQVFGHTNMDFGTYAEYLCVNQTNAIVLKPLNVSHIEAAIIPFGGLTALFFLKKAKIKKGDKVLITGASGAVGTAAIQLAKTFGAEVTGVCSTNNLELVKSLGADYVIDYSKEDILQYDEKYDVVFDTVNSISILKGNKSTKKEGTMIFSAANFAKIFAGIWFNFFSDKKIITGVSNPKKEDLICIKEMVEKGKFKPVLDRIYTLDQISLAHAYVELGHKKGNVAIEI